MINKEFLLIRFPLLVQPELVFRNISKSVVLAIIRELFVDVGADIRTVHNPNTNLTSLADLL
jgi:hypothetical protein